VKAIAYHTSKVWSASLDAFVAGNLPFEHARVNWPVESVHEKVVDFVKDNCAELYRVVGNNCLVNDAVKKFDVFPVGTLSEGVFGVSLVLFGHLLLRLVFTAFVHSSSIAANYVLDIVHESALLDFHGLCRF
jgi:hypothetical protein